LLPADSSALTRSEKQDLNGSSAMKESMAVPSTSLASAPVLCDLGSAMSLDDGLEHREDIQSDVYRAPEIVLDFKPPNSDFLFTDIEWALRKTWAVNIPEWTESCLPPDLAIHTTFLLSLTRTASEMLALFAGRYVFAYFRGGGEGVFGAGFEGEPRRVEDIEVDVSDVD
jgi:hypothetical protein